MPPRCHRAVLAHAAACLTPRLAAAAAGLTPSPRPTEGVTSVAPTTDAATALADFDREGFCVLQGVLSPSQVQLYRDHMLGVLGTHPGERDAGGGSREHPPWAPFIRPLSRSPARPRLILLPTRA
jgi:hypothetical protein